MAMGSLMTEMGMTEHEIQRRLRLVAFGPSDVKRVLALSDLIVHHAGEYTAAFFDYLRATDEAATLVHDHATLEVARRLKTEHLKGMARGEYGPSYVEERLKLGMLYALAGLDSAGRVPPSDADRRLSGDGGVQNNGAKPHCAFARPITAADPRPP